MKEMKSRSVIVQVVAVIFGSLVVFSIGSGLYLSHVTNTSPKLRNPGALREAVNRYIQEQGARGEALSGTVTLRTLIEGGYIRADEVRAFDGMEVTFFLTTDRSRLDAEEIRLETPKFGRISLRADGSVQMR